MSTLPSMPMFWAEFFADTEHLTEDAAKAHLFLIGHAWLRHAKLPKDDLALARMARVSPRKWAAIKGAVMALWQNDENGLWTQKRMRKEYDFVCAKREINRENGKSGGTRSAGKRSIKSAEPPKRTGNHPTPTLIESSLRSDSPPPPKELKIQAHLFDPEPIRLLGEMWNELAAANPQLLQIDEIEPRSKREKNVKRTLPKIIKGTDARSAIKAYVGTVGRSDYLMGRVNGFLVDFDWIADPDHCDLILGGRYENRQNRQAGSADVGSRHVGHHR